MHANRHTHWRDPGYWRWWWHHRVSVDTKIVAVIVLVATGVNVYLLRGAFDEHRKAATFTPPHAVTAVPRKRANSSEEAVTRSRSTSGAADVRMEVLSVTPRPPQAARPFALVARVAFAPAPGSIRCSVWIGGQQYRKVRLVWESPIARCFGHVPEGARGERLQIELSAVLGESRTQTRVAYVVS